MDIFNSSSSIRLTFPTVDIFKIPTQPALHTPSGLENTPAGNFFYPFDVNATLYQTSMSLDFVLTFVAIYVASVHLLNNYNAANQYRPWALTKSPLFKPLMLVHNASLALFSAWCLGGMIHTHYQHWVSAKSGLELTYSACAEFVCQFDSTSYRILNKTKIPSEGLVYIYWIFYMSKFYEVVDTLIILARGKTSSTLQTFHHAGVVLIGWTGLRNESPMAPPGAMMNAGVHTLMYSYFTLQTAGLYIPKWFKRALTRIQIAQFVLGLMIASFYVLLNYTAPLNTAQDTFKAAKDPGWGISSRSGNVSIEHEEMTVPCLDTYGGAFPLVVASSYLFPLIYLFVKFYIKAYSAPIARTR
ncbi:hypothetical protein N7540_005559 [Penicillium herquei]|nr:hypothetical protein N7540_005559 [Penicillium herquei]